MLSPPPPAIWTVLLAGLTFAALVLIARRSRAFAAPSTYVVSGFSRTVDVVSGFSRTRWAPLLAGLLTLIAVRIVWGSFSEPGVIHDERAYLLQASIFAQGQWTLPSPPLPAFFEQMHVFVEPAVFAKYPPGHALVLAFGAWLGLPGLMPVLLAALSGGLIFWIARRLANEWVSLFTWWLWTTGWANLYWAASYFSETTSTAMWWLAVFGTIRWLDSGRTAYLTLAAAALAFGIETRPLTIVALSLPLAWVIVRRLKDVATAATTLALPAVAALAILALGPIWNQQTLGDWRQNPYSYYSQAYFPFDKPGFGVDATPPLRQPQPELAAVGEWSRQVHSDYVPAALPVAFVKRILSVLFWTIDGWRLWLGVLILAAVLHGSRIERLGLAAAGTLFLGYLSFAHPPMWIVYYVEILPILYFLAACQMGRLFHTLSGAGRGDGPVWPAHVTAAAAVTALLLVPLGVSDVWRVRGAVDQRNAFHRSARAAVEKNTPVKSIVFVRYSADHNPHLALTGYGADLASTGRWVAFDRGDRNRELLSLAPGVPAFVLDTSTLRVAPLTNESNSRADNSVDEKTRR
ncbi:MAG TPA: hypothetical protein VFO58_08155 [Vicinamibacterales bacterium]|nr:hypothetical protein [Vicinamibacterales bacterium]